MGAKQEVEERFLKDVANHEMTVIRNEGTSRHIRFRKPGTICYGFDLVTWPGLLCYTGDMGTYVFSRIPDMFEFFRCQDGKDLFTISTGYWAEKVLSADRDGVRKFSSEKFISVTKEYFNDVIEDLPKEEREALLERLEEEVLSLAYDADYPAMRAAIEFEHEGRLLMQDFWEVNCEEYTSTFLWCCYAIQWGISVYDKDGE